MAALVRFAIWNEESPSHSVFTPRPMLGAGTRGRTGVGKSLAEQPGFFEQAVELKMIDRGRVPNRGVALDDPGGQCCGRCRGGV